MGTHTPGPWRVNDETSLRFGDCSLSHQVWAPPARVAFVEAQNVGLIAAEANARLIAAAPELLEALRSVDAALNGRVHSSPALGALSRVRDLIAKIDGGHQGE